MASSSAQQQQQQPWLSASTFNGGANFVPTTTKLWFNNTSSNYQAWKQQILCIIESQGLLGFIDGTITPPPPETLAAGNNNNNHDYDSWRRSDLLLRGWILCSLNDDVVYTVSSFTTSRDIWLELENRFLQFFYNSAPLINTVTDQVTANNTITEENNNNNNNNNNNSNNNNIYYNTYAREKDLKEYLPLHRAALQGNWEAAEGIFKSDPASMTASLTHIQTTALHTAVGTGKSNHFVEQLVGMMPDDASIAFMDDSGATALCVAAAVGNIEAATILVNRLPNLLYMPNIVENFPVQIAALYAQRDMLKYLISVTKDDLDWNPYAGFAGLRLLLFVIDAEFFDIALYLVEKYPDLARTKLLDNTSALKKISANDSVFSHRRRFNLFQRFISSCVYVEPSIWRPQSANDCDIESLTHKGETLCQSLYSLPWKFVEGIGLIKNIKEKMLLKQQALKLVKCFCKEIESLSFTEAKEMYFDAIMIAARLGIREVVEEIVEVFPSAIYCATPSSQYIFHVSVENRCERVYNLIYQMSDHKHFYSDLQDSNGNNVLHLAGKLAPSHKLNQISGAALQMQSELQWYKEVEKFVHPHARERLNNAWKTPRMVFTEEHRILKEEGEKWMKDTANSCSIAAALIITMVFAAAITVPGGNVGDTGLPIFSTNTVFVVFAISDAISLFTSTTSLLMFLSILTSRYAEEDFLRNLPKRLIIGLGTLFLSITFMMVAFSATLYLVFGQEKAWVLIPVAGMACLPVTSFVLLQFPLLVDLFSSTYGRGIFGKQSNRPFY